MADRFFDQDKNYILKDVQKALKEELCEQAIHQSVSNFLFWENPLGLVDDFVLQLQKDKVQNVDFLYPIYQLLSGAYRFKYGANQLSFVWDGRSHYEVYQEEWKEEFIKWINKLGGVPAFNRAILKACLINPDQPLQMLSDSLFRIVSKELKIKRNSKGQIKKVA